MNLDDIRLIPGMGTLVLFIGLTGGAPSCKCDKGPESAPTPVPSVIVAAPSGAPTPAPSVAFVSPAEPLLLVPGYADYSSWYGVKARIASKSDAEAEQSDWKLPYPYRLVLYTIDNPQLEDCGFFPTLQGVNDDRWRTAYCLIGDDRAAHRLYIRVRQDARGRDVYDFELRGLEGGQTHSRLHTGFRTAHEEGEKLEQGQAAP